MPNLRKQERIDRNNRLYDFVVNKGWSYGRAGQRCGVTGDTASKVIRKMGGRSTAKPYDDFWL